MSIQIITKKEAFAHVGKSYNPPTITELQSEEDFYSEWYAVQRGLAGILKSFGENDAYGQADYYIADSATLSRGINVCITSTKPLSPTLISQTQEYLKTVEHAYEVDYTISTRDGDFEVFVSRDAVLAWCPEDILNRLRGR